MPEIRTRRSTGMNIIRNIATATGGAINDYFQEAMPTTTNTAKGLINAIDTGTDLIGKGLRRTTDVARLLYKELSFRKILGWFTREESDLDDFGFDDFDSSFSFGEENESSDSNENLPVITEEAKSANKVAKSVVGSSHKLVEAQIATAATTITSIDAQTKTIVQGFTQTNEILNKILEITTKNTASLVEATLSAGVQKNYQSTNQSPERVTDDFVRSRGFNFENYKKVVKQNFGNDPQLTMMFSMAPMIFGLLDNDMMMKQFLSRDFLASQGFSLAMDHFFPNLKDMLKTIDEGIGNAIMDGLLALGEYGKNGNGGFLGTIGKFFGVTSEKETYSASRKNIELGPVPFDGITKEAITNVIPGYLQQILVALGGQDRQYDYENRKFMTAEEMREMIMGNITNEDTFRSLSDDLKKVIAGNEAGIANKKDSYIIENLMQSLMEDHNLRGTINSLKDKKELESYIKHTAFKNIKIDDVLKNEIPVFSERLSNALNNKGLDFDLFRAVQQQKITSNSLLDQENAKQNAYDRNIDWIFGKNKKDNLEKRYLASRLGIEYIEDKDENEKKEDKLENILSGDSTFVDIITSPLDYASRALYEIYRRLSVGINVFKVGEYNKNAAEYQHKKFEYDAVLKEPEGYSPLTLRSPSGNSGSLGTVANKLKDVWFNNRESNEELTEEQKIEKRWEDGEEDDDPFALYDAISDQNKGRQNLLLNGKDENLSGSNRLGRFAKSAFGSIFSAFMSRDPTKMKAAMSNLRNDIKEYGLNGLINDTFRKDVVDGFTQKIKKYFGNTENIDKYDKLEKALKDNFEAYQKAAFDYKQLAESENEKTEEELNQLKERFLIAKQAAEESFNAAGIEGAFDIDLGNKDARQSNSRAVQKKLLRTLEKSSDFENKNEVIKKQMLKISKTKDENDIVGLANLALHQKGLDAIQSPQGGPEDTISNPLNKDAIITSLPGYRNFGGELDYHTGTDLAAADGSKHVPIISQQSGIVSNILKNVPENGGDVDSYKGKYPSSGNFVEIQSPQGGPEDTIQTSYMHMEQYSTNLNIGDKVEAGDIIGRTGSSGRSTGDHLHYEQSILPSGGPEDKNKSAQEIVENEIKETEQDMSFKKLQERAIRDAYRRSIIKTSTITGGIIGLMMGGPIGGAIAAGIGNLTSRLDVNGHVSTVLFGEKNAKNKDGILKPYTQALKDSVLGGVGDILKQVGYSAFNYYINPFRNLSRVLYMRMVYGKNGKESIFDQMHKAFSFATGKIHNIFGIVLDEVKEHFSGLTNIIGEINSGFKNVIVDNLITPVKNFLEEHKDNVIVKGLTYIANIPKLFTSWVGKQFGKLFGGLFKGIGNFFGLNKFKEKGLLGGLFSAIGTTAKNVLPLVMFASNPLLGAGLLGARLAAHRIGKFTKGNEEGSLDANQEIHNERLAEQADLGVISEETAQRKMVGGNNGNSNETENSNQPVVDATDRTTEAVKELGPTIGDKLKELGERIIAAIKSIRPQEPPSSGGPKINISSLNKQNIGGPEKENNNSAGWFTTLLTSILSIPGGLSERAARIVTSIGGVLSSGKASLSKLKSFLPSLIRTSKDEHTQNSGTRSIGSIFGWLKNKITGNKKDDKNDDKENNGKEKSGGIFNTLKNIITGPLGKMSLGAGLLMLTDSDTISKGLDVAWGGLKKAGSWLLESGASIFGFAKEKAKDLGSFIMAASDNLWDRAKESVTSIFSGDSEPLKANLDWASTNFTRMAGLSFILGSGTLGKFFLKGAIGTYALKKFTEWNKSGEVESTLEKVLPKDVAKDLAANTGDLPVVSAATLVDRRLGGATLITTSIGTAWNQLEDIWKNFKFNDDEHGLISSTSKSIDTVLIGAIKGGIGGALMGIPGSLWLVKNALIIYGAKKLLGWAIDEGKKYAADYMGLGRKQAVVYTDEKGNSVSTTDFTENDDGSVTVKLENGDSKILNKNEYTTEEKTTEGESIISHEDIVINKNVGIDYDRLKIPDKYFKNELLTKDKLSHDFLVPINDESKNKIFYKTENGKRIYLTADYETQVGPKGHFELKNKLIIGNYLEHLKRNDSNKYKMLQESLANSNNSEKAINTIYTDIQNYARENNLLGYDVHTQLDQFIGSGQANYNYLGIDLKTNETFRSEIEKKANLDKLKRIENSKSMLILDKAIDDKEKAYLHAVINAALASKSYEDYIQETYKDSDTQHKYGIYPFWSGGDETYANDFETIVNNIIAIKEKYNIDISKIKNRSDLFKIFEEALNKNDLTIEDFDDLNIGGPDDNTNYTSTAPITTSNEQIKITPKNPMDNPEYKKNNDKGKNDIKEQAKQKVDWWGNPVQGGTRITSPWGMRRHPKTGRPKWHSGIDIGSTEIPQSLKEKMKVNKAISSKINIVSTVEGTAQVDGGNRTGDSPAQGNMVRVYSKDGQYIVTYMHLAPGTIPNINGKTVIPGQKIGEMGNTGSSTGPHLHYQINKKGQPKLHESDTSNINGFGFDVNPKQMISGKGYDPSLLGNVEVINPYDPNSTETSDGGIFGGIFKWINDIKNKFLEVTGLGSLFGLSTSSFISGNSNSGTANNYSSIVSSSDSKPLFEYLKQKGYSDASAAGILGSLSNESSLKSNRVEGDHTKSFNSDTYGGYNMITDALNDKPEKMNLWVSKYLAENTPSGINTEAYRGKINRNNYYPGIGLAQWTGPRAERLLEYSKKRNKNWDDFTTQLDYLSDEVNESYGIVSPEQMNARVKDNPQAAAELWTRKFEGYRLAKGIEKRKASAVAIYNENKPSGGPDIGGADSSFFINDAFSMIFNNLQKNRESIRQQEFIQQQNQTQNSNNYRSMITDALGNIITSDSRVSGNSILSSILTKDNIGAILNPKDNSNINLRDTIRSSISTVVSDSKFARDNSILSAILNKDNLDKIMSSSPSQRRSIKKSEEQQKKVQRAEISKSKPNYDDPEYINRRWKEITEKYNEKKASDAAKSISTILPETLEAKIQKLTEQNPEIAKDKKKDINAELMQQMVSLLQQVVGNTGASNNILDKINSKEFTANIELPKQTNNMQNNRSNNRGVAPDFTNKQTLNLVSHLITGR